MHPVIAALSALAVICILWAAVRAASMHRALVPAPNCDYCPLRTVSPWAGKPPATLVGDPRPCVRCADAAREQRLLQLIPKARGRPPAREETNGVAHHDGLPH